MKTKIQLLLVVFMLSVHVAWTMDDSPDADEVNEVTEALGTMSISQHAQNQNVQVFPDEIWNIILLYVNPSAEFTLFDMQSPLGIVGAIEVNIDRLKNIVLVNKQVLKLGQSKMFQAKMCTYVNKTIPHALSESLDEFGKSLKTILNDHKWNALHWAARSGRVDIVIVVLKTKSEYKQLVFAVSDSGKTPLHVAAMHGNVKIVRLLREAAENKALVLLDLKTIDHKRTAYKEAKELENLEIMEYLKKERKTLKKNGHH